MGRDGVLPRVLGKVHPKYQTPWVAAIFLGAFSLVLTLTAGQFGGMTVLAPMVNFGALASFIVLNFGVFWYSGARRSSAAERPFCATSSVPGLAFLS